MNHTFKLLISIAFFLIITGCRETNKPKQNHTESDKKETVDNKTQNFDKHVVAGGTYSFERPQNFGLAVNKEQILKKSYIPPCKNGFDYCLYYNGKKYKNTNFESAGVGFYILKNTGKEACLSANNYNGRKENLHTETINGTKFTVFSSGDAGMGHYAKDVVYRTFQNGVCYVFIARIGISQFENYEPGSIQKFTPTMKKEIRNDLKNIIQGINFN